MRVEFEKLELVLENKQGVFRYDRNTKILYARFWGIPNKDLLKELFQAMMDYATQNQIIGAVCDLTKVTGTFTSLNSWLNSHFYPHMLSLGYKYVTMTSSSNPFTMFALTALINLTGPKGIENKMLSNMDDCENWIYDKMGIKSLTEA